MEFRLRREPGDLPIPAGPRLSCGGRAQAVLTGPESPEPRRRAPSLLLCLPSQNRGRKEEESLACLGKGCFNLSLDASVERG